MPLHGTVGIFPWKGGHGRGAQRTERGDAVEGVFGRAGWTGVGGEGEVGGAEGLLAVLTLEEIVMSFPS